MTTGADERIQQVRSEIEEAFSDVPYPTKGEVVSSYDGQKLVRDFTGRHWKDIPFETLKNSSLSFFSREGFHFFVPAFLLASLRPDALIIRQNVVFALGPERDEPAKVAEFLERVRDFTDRQRLAIKNYMELMSDEFSYDFGSELPALSPNGHWRAEGWRRPTP